MHLSTSQKLALRASLFSTILSPCHAYVNWLYPQSSARNLVYNYNDLVYFTWDSNFTEPSLTLWCASDNSYYTREFTPPLSLFLPIYLSILSANPLWTDPGSSPFKNRRVETDHSNHSLHRQRHHKRHLAAKLPLRGLLQPIMPHVPLLPRLPGLRARRPERRVLPLAQQGRGGADVGARGHGVDRRSRADGDGDGDGNYDDDVSVFDIVIGGGGGEDCDWGGGSDGE